MGTDAHAMVEVRLGNQWVIVNQPVWPTVEQGKVFDVVPGLPRHYGLFSVLADVTNRTGRMGKTQIVRHVEGLGDVTIDYDMDDGGHEPITPIAEPRGIPTDAHQAWKDFASQEAVHSPTYFTLAELREADPLLDQRLYEDCVVPSNEYEEFRDNGTLPRLRPRGVGGEGVITITPEEYEAGVRGEQGTAVHIRWIGKTVKEEVHTFWNALLGMMELIAPDQDHSKVRLLVAFDS